MAKNTKVNTAQSEQTIHITNTSQRYQKYFPKTSQAFHSKTLSKEITNQTLKTNTNIYLHFSKQGKKKIKEYCLIKTQT